jgi:hypothetical protein
VSAQLLERPTEREQRGKERRRTMTVSILVDVVLGDRLSPRSSALELDVVDVDASVDNVDVDALSGGLVVLVLGEGRETKSLAMRESSETLAGNGEEMRTVSRSHPWTSTALPSLLRTGLCSLTQGAPSSVSIVVTTESLSTNATIGSSLIWSTRSSEKVPA